MNTNIENYEREVYMVCIRCGKLNAVSSTKIEQYRSSKGGSVFCTYCNSMLPFSRYHYFGMLGTCLGMIIGFGVTIGSFTMLSRMKEIILQAVLGSFYTPGLGDNFIVSIAYIAAWAIGLVIIFTNFAKLYYRIRYKLVWVGDNVLRKDMVDEFYAGRLAESIAGQDDKQH